MITGGVCCRRAGEGDSSCQGASKATRRTIRRSARRRQEEMTELGEKELGALLAESVQQGIRPVSRELLPLPIPFLENEHVESERLHSLSRAVRSRVMRRVGWQGWANDGVLNLSEIYSKTSASESGSRPSSLQLSSLSQICDAYRGLDTPEMVLNRPLSRRVSFPCPTHVRRWQMVLPFCLVRTLKLGGIGAGFCFARQASFMKRSRWKGELLFTLTQSSSGNLGVTPDSHVT